MGRASKRQQRARDELESLATTQLNLDSSDQEDHQPNQDHPSHFSSSINTFASLGHQQLSSEDQELESQSESEIKISKVIQFTHSTL